MSEIHISSAINGVLNSSEILKRKDKVIKEQIALASQRIREHAEDTLDYVNYQIDQLMVTEAAQENLWLRNKGKMSMHQYACVMATLLMSRLLSDNHVVENTELVSYDVAYDMFYKIKISR